jgi:transposase
MIAVEAKRPFAKARFAFRLLTDPWRELGFFDSLIAMLKKPSFEQTAIEMVTLDSQVPPDHLLRKIDAAIDFSFIHELTAPLYCADNGRPPLDPTLMFKALFIGYLFGIRSEQQLVREIEVNVAYRWFLRLKLTEKVFDASTLSQNRRGATRTLPCPRRSSTASSSRRWGTGWWMGGHFTRIPPI